MPTSPTTTTPATPLLRILYERGITITALARDLCATRSFVSGVAHGRYRPSPRLAAHIATLLDVDVHELFPADALHERRGGVRGATA